MGKRTERKSILDRYFATGEVSSVEEGGRIDEPNRVLTQNSGKILDQPASESDQNSVDQNELTIAAGIFNSQFAVSSTGQAEDGDQSIDTSSPSRLFNTSGGGNLFRPRINGIDKTLTLGKRVSVDQLFEYLDLDGNPLYKISVLDTTQARTSGYWRLGRNRLDSGQWHTFYAEDISRLSFQSGLVVGIDKIQLRVQDTDGVTQRWSLIDTVDITTVENNDRPPVATIDDIDALASESYQMSNFISATDPDGFDIARYRVKYKGAGSLFLNGVKLAKKQWHTFNASRLDELVFQTRNHATDVKTTKINVRANDGSVWSLVDKGKVTADPNRFAPDVLANDRNVARNEQLAAHTMFSPSDPDGNTVKRVAFYDTGIAPDGGYFTVGGVVQGPREWFEVSAEELTSVRYNAAAILDQESFRVKVFDGMYWSDFQTATVSTIEKPVVDLDDITVVGEREEIQVSSLFSQSDVGPALTEFEVLDFNDDPLSGSFQLAGVDLEAGIVHRVAASELQDLTFVGGSIDDRYTDQIMIRANNSQHWSDWSRGSVNTEPNMVEALNQLPTWNAGPGSGVEVTFSFCQIVPDYYADDADERDGFRPFNGLMRAAARDALEDWSRVSGISFREVSDAVGGVIRFGLTEMDEAILGYAYIPDGVLSPDRVQGDIWINHSSVLAGTLEDPLFNQDRGSEGYMTLLHEIGHAVGHSHPFDRPIRLPGNTDNHNFTVMSYQRRFSGNAPGAPMLYDIAANQAIYGTNTEFNSGDTVYEFPTDVTPVEAIWDPSGIDTFDFSEHSRNVSIDLRSGQFSSYGTDANNMNIAYGAFIENAIGGSGDDELTGNQLENVLEGGIGADEFRGLGGNDLMSGQAGNDGYVVGIGDGHDTIEERQGGGIDRLRIDLTGVDLGPEYVEEELYDQAFEDHIAARKFNGDLFISMSTRGETAYGSVVIKDFENELSRVETLQIYQGEEAITRDVDLGSVYISAGDEYSRFEISDFSSEFGQIALPS
ncbi:MAG: M10 family metallopeptidase C-terminal domain-containing protein [Planctomycetota bacterium]|nr:M10 family metallopeptidase C-terminal domain-containing protein [Planctomycetota bacterium]